MRKFTIYLIFFLSTIHLLAQDSLETKEVISLQEKVKVLENNLEEVQNNQNNYKKECQLNHKTILSDMKSLKLEFVDYLKILTYFGIPVTLIGMIVLGYTTFKKAEKMAREQVEKRVARIIEEKREELVKLIQSQDLEEKIKKHSRIIVLSNGIGEEKHIKPLLKQFGFDVEKTKYEIVNDYERLTNYDLIIFNNFSNNFNKQLLGTYLEQSTNKDIFLAYTNERLQQHPRLSFANSQFTLYTNMMNALKFEKLLS